MLVGIRHRLLSSSSSSSTFNIINAVRDFMFNQIKLRLELADPQVQSSKIQSTFRVWVTQLACVMNRTACRSILAWASSLVDSANVMLHNVDAADQRDDQLAANSMTARNLIEDVNLSMVNQDHRQLFKSRITKTWLL